MHTSLLFAAAFASVALAQGTSTVQVVTEFPDGQPQAPGSATSASPAPMSMSYTNPFTSLTSLTSSVGVVTGMPSVATSQPSVVISQPSIATSMPSSYGYSNTTTMPVMTSPKSNYTIISSTQTASGLPTSFSMAASSVGTTTAPSASISTTNAGVMRRVAGTSMALAVVGSLVVALL